MATITKQFDMAFYKKVYEAIEDAKSRVEEEIYDSNPFFFHLEVGTYDVELEAWFHIDMRDDSFDHAFGTERCEPYPVLENLEHISKVKVYDENDNEVQGFSVDMFWSQFDIDYFSPKHLHKGDKVILHRYSTPEETCSFVSYNTMLCEFKVMRDDGTVLIVVNKEIRKVSD